MYSIYTSVAFMTIFLLTKTLRDNSIHFITEFHNQDKVVLTFFNDAFGLTLVFITPHKKQRPKKQFSEQPFFGIHDQTNYSFF